MIVYVYLQEVYNEYVFRGCKNKCYLYFYDIFGQLDDFIYYYYDYYYIFYYYYY